MEEQINKRKWFKRVIYGITVVIVLIIAVKIVTNISKDQEMADAEWSNQQHLDGYVLNDSLEVTRNDEGITIKNSYTDEVRAKDIQFDWVYHSNDTLSVFCSDNKRGYYNRYTGRIVIPALYRRAWVFSGNLAAVQKNGYIGFVNRRGEVAIPFKYPYHGNPLTSFLFKDGHCVVANEEGKCGVIDTVGNWVIRPLYKNVSLQKDYAVVFNPGSAMQIDFHGVVMNSFIVDNIQELYYTQTAWETVNGERQWVERNLPTGYFSYIVGGQVGLMDAHCNRLTEAIYESIEAKSPTMFVATLIGYEGKVIIDNNGKVIK